MGKNPAEKAKNSASAKEAKKEEIVVSKKEAKSSKKKAPVLEAKKRSELHCKAGKCKREYRAKGYCDVHYKQWKQGAFGIARYKTCKEMDCRKPMGLNRFGYCEDHFQNYYVKGQAKPQETAAPQKADKAEVA